LPEQTEIEVLFADDNDSKVEGVTKLIHFEPDSRIVANASTMAEALDLMTLKGAYATFLDPMKGSLTPGKLADLIILSADPLAVDPAELLSTEVWLTMVGGQARGCAPGRSAWCP
jgi:predicted amidohydrolase YtcJ